LNKGGHFEEQLSRRGFMLRLGATLGAGVAGSLLLSACGRHIESAKGTEGAPSRGGNGGGLIARASEVAPNSSINFTDSGQPAVLVHLESGGFVAYSAVCTHLGCTVAYQESYLVCPCHGAVYDPAHQAEVLQGPAPRPLQRIPIKVENGRVLKV
jgi:Rieske Fe-S protein